MAATVDDLIGIMENLAPPGLAEKWDNVGLQVGCRDWPARSVWVALDPLPEVVAAACREKVHLLITHHPLIFSPLRRIDFATPTGKSVYLAAQNRLAIYAAHTNYDSFFGGLNDILAHRIGLKNLRPLVSANAEADVKLVVFTALEHEQEFLTALFDAGDGRIGDHSISAFRVSGTEMFKPQPETGKKSGRRGAMRREVAKVRIEAVVSARDLPGLLGRLQSNLFNEATAYDVYPLVPAQSPLGIGRWGELASATDLRSLALHVKKQLGLKSLRMIGQPDLAVGKVAVCTGSGGSLMTHFLNSPAEVFISGDLRYHEARDAQAAGRGVIDVGHFASEHIMVPELTQQLRSAIAAKGLEAEVFACTLESDPFVQI